MSEKTYVHHRHEQDRPMAELHNHELEKLDELIESASRHSRHEHAEKLDEIRQEVESKAHETVDLQAVHAEQERNEAAPSVINRDLKDIKYQRTLQSVRRNLSAPEKALSKLIHNPVVDALSSGAEKTIARPSGLLAGSFFAFLGSSVFLYIAKHYGYEYNFLLFAMFFAGGFVLGLALEFVFRIFKKAPKS